jgi:type IV secretion system protein VirB6
MSGCPILSTSGPAGIADALRSVDCMAGQATAQAFGRLFGPDGALGSALTLLLTLYVAWLAIGLITGRATLSLSALTPRMMGLGLVLTFATSWVAYQSVVWSLASDAPDQLASLLMGSHGSASFAFAHQLDGLFTAVTDAAQAAQDAAAGTTTKAAAFFSPADVLWLGALMLLLGTVGVLIVAKIALAALLALGPVFILFALFPGTRGLFEGWIKGVVTFALAPLFAVLIGSATLAMMTPLITAFGLSELTMRAAVTLFLAAAIYCALMALVLKVTTTITAGWRIGFAQPSQSPSPGSAGPHLPAASSGSVSPGTPPLLGPMRADERVRAVATAISPVSEGAAPADAGRTRIVLPAPAASAISSKPVESRTRGLGQSFRAPPSALRLPELKP